MRRRSERKKSTSPAPLPARRSRRSRKVSENERAEEDSVVHKDAENQEMTEVAATREEINDAPDRERASSEERAASPSPVRKSRSSRTTPKKRVESKSSDKKVETIPEEGENGADSDKCQSSRNNADAGKREKREKRTPLAADIVDESKSDAEPAADPQPKQEPEAEVEKPQPEPGNAKKDVKDVDKSDDEKPTQDDGHDDDGRRRQSIHIQEVKVPSPSISLTASKEEEHLKTSSDVLDIQTEDVEERDDEAVAAAAVDADAAAAEDTPKSERREERKRKHKEQLPIKTKDEQKENRKQSVEQPAPAQDEAIDLPNNNKHETSVTATPPTAPAGAAAGVLQSQRSVRKRKWLTNKKSTDRAPPVLAISTDSLKNIISDVVPVPLSDVQLDSSSEEEGLVTSDHESDRSVSPLVRKERERECDESGTVTVVTATDNSVAESNAAKDATAGTGRTTPALATDIVQVHVGKSTVPSAKPNVVRSPSPARNRSSHVLYITNLVRPFTVLQLKGLLARTGKIVEDGFWIDRIKSKCFVAYSNEDEAIETRHALHGVRWPVSNPKCLNVDFGSRTDMDRAIQLTKDEPPRYGQENTRDNQQAGSAWSRLDATDKKPARPVREWDVGKKEPNDRDKIPNDRRRGSKERVVDSRSRDVERPGQDRKRSREGEGVRGRERERIERNNDRNAHGRSRSGSPLPKTKRKENEPPIRLLDDLFRKTKITPCIYWLPLTPEAIAEKEAFRQKRIEEHKLRIKEREERQKEREKERDRQRDTRRNRSNERRHSRSRERERRRY